MAKKRLFILAAIAICAAALIASLFYARQIQQDNILIKEEEEVDKLKQENEDVIQRAIEEKQIEVSAVSDEDHLLGNKNAPVKFVIYSDFEDPFSADYSKTVKQVKDEFGDQIVIAFRHFPQFAINANALTAALATECAAEQGFFWEMYDKIFADNSAGKLTPEELKKTAVELGLDEQRFSECMAEEKYMDKILEQRLSGVEAGVNGTPNTFVNGQSLPGAYQFEDFVDSAGINRQGLKTIINKYLVE